MCAGASFALFVSGVVAQDCYLASSMQGSAAQNLAYALQNVSCPVNFGYIQLLTYNNLTSIPVSSTAIVATLKDSTAYFNASAFVDSSTSTDLWRGPILDIPFELTQWVNQLLGHKMAIINAHAESSLPDELTQQRDAAKSFIDTVIAKSQNLEQNQVKAILSPVLDELNCAIGAFKSGSSVDACSISSASMSSTSTPTSGSSTAASAANTSSAARATHPINTALAGLLFAYCSVCFFSS